MPGKGNGRVGGLDRAREVVGENPGKALGVTAASSAAVTPLGQRAISSVTESAPAVIPTGGDAAASTGGISLGPVLLVLVVVLFVYLIFK